MRRVVLTGLLLLVASAGVPSPAEAFLFDGWLERLSGPGPFHVTGIRVPVACRGVSTDAPAPTSEGEPQVQWLDPAIAGCHRARRGQPRLEFGVEVAYVRTDENPLLYDPPISRDDRKVSGLLLVGTVDTSVHRMLDIGIGGGALRLRRHGFTAVTKPLFEPLRVTVKPFAASSRVDRTNRRWEALQFRLTAIILPAVDAEDFGAVPGSFREPGELLWEATVVFDVTRLIAP